MFTDLTVEQNRRLADDVAAMAPESAVWVRGARLLLPHSRRLRRMMDLGCPGGLRKLEHLVKVMEGAPQHVIGLTDDEEIRGANWEEWEAAAITVETEQSWQLQVLFALALAATRSGVDEAGRGSKRDRGDRDPPGPAARPVATTPLVPHGPPLAPVLVNFGVAA
jgi:hypothetical protein